MGINPNTAVTQEKQDIVGIIDDMLANKDLFGGTKSISGLFQAWAGIPGTPAADMANKFETLKAKLSLDNRKLLKGSGQISDYESKMLEKASTGLSRTQSETAFRKTLEDLRNSLSGQGATSGVGGKTSGGFIIKEVK
jgi:hypothetical protein